MQPKSTYAFLLIIAVIALLVFDFSSFFQKYLFLPDFLNVNYKLGLDLVGGTVLTYQADLSQVPAAERKDALDNTKDLIERRVNTIGVSEPKITYDLSQGRLLVELASVKSPEEAKQIIGETPFLEFKEQRSASDTQTILDAQKKGERKDEDPYFASTGLTGRYLQNATLDFDNFTNEPRVSIQFNGEGAKLFEAITSRSVGKPVAIYLDGQAISAPTVQEAITGGKAQITGKFTLDEARKLVSRLNQGALPIPIQPIAENTVSGTLGTEVFHAILTAGIVGFLLVALFMLLYYRLSGLSAILALSVYVLLNLALYKLFGVVLTLAGIAGFILSLGMAVDANILVFERTREEIKTHLAIEKDANAAPTKETLLRSLQNGFSRAWPSIRDSNLTTIIANTIIYLLATSFIKGFALTLTVGVLTSLLTSIWLTRYILAMIFSAAPKRNILLP